MVLRLVRLVLVFPVKSSTDPMWPDNIWIKFKFVSDGNTANKDGWMVDHITIYADYYAGLDEQNTSFVLMFIQIPVMIFFRSTHLTKKSRT